MGVDELMRKLYTAPTQQTKEHFLHVNAHVVNGHARRGQLVVVTPADPDRCSELEYAFAEMVRHVDAVSRFEGGDSAPEIVNRFYDVLSFVDGQAAGGVGAFATAYGNRVKSVAQVLREIEELYVRTFNQHGRLNTRRFFIQRRRLFERLDNALGSMIRSRIVDPRYTRMKTALGLSTKSTLHAWRRRGPPVSAIPGFHRHYQRVDRLARHLRWLGRVGIGLDVLYSYRQIREACTVDNDDPACTRRVFEEGGRLPGSIAGGAAGGYLVGYGMCTVVFALPSGGTSLIWCGILAGGAGAFAGGWAGGEFGKAIGEIVYENIYQTAR